MPANWVWNTPPRDTPLLRLLLLPNAGAGASAFRGWTVPNAVQLLPIQLPGREDRLAEPPFSHLPELVHALGPALERWLDLPFAIYGHSMGALLAFELTRWLHAENRPLPVRLFVAGHRAPHLPDPGPFFHAAPEPALLDELRRLCGTHPDVLANRELMALYLPTVRADLSVCETYHYTPAPPLDCPITALGGAHDTEASPAELLGWRDHTSRQFQLRIFEGDHFFPVTARAAVLQSLLADLAQHLASAPDAPADPRRAAPAPTTPADPRRAAAAPTTPADPRRAAPARSAQPRSGPPRSGDFASTVTHAKSPR